MDAKPENRRHRIVVLDDDEDSREVFAALLEMNGFQVETAETALEALASIGAAAPAVVVLDIGLAKGIDGYETAARIRALPAGNAIRLVAMTGYPAALVRQKSPHFDAILTKPVDADELVAIIERHTRKL